jgi:hypothetical protein
MKKKIFFSHSKLLYHKPVEAQALGFIRKCFPTYEIFNPSDLELQYTVDVIRRCIAELRECELLIAIEYQSYVGKGVYREFEYGKKFGIDRFVIRKDNSGSFRLFRIEKIQVVNVKDYIAYARINQVSPI